jgi:hypothetical protein
MLKESVALGTNLMIVARIFVRLSQLVELLGTRFLDWKEDEFLEK